MAVGPQSIFVVVSWGSELPCCISILQLETQKHDDHEDLTGKQSPMLRPFSTLETQLNQKEYVAHFSRPPWSSMDWMVSLLTTSSTSTEEDLYMLPYQSHDADVPLRASVFDFRTKTHRTISLPDFKINILHVVTLGGCIYAISHPHHSDDIMFMCYDPARGLWNHREPFPGDATNADCIMATAVWEKGNTVLFNMKGLGIWAYDVKTDKWCRVHVKTDKRWCYSIVGEAVVLGNTIYALTKQDSDLLLALSIQREDGEDCRFVCSLRCQISLDIIPHSLLGAQNRTRHLVHFGDDSFCLVQCGQNEYPDDYQPIQLTNIKLSEENSMTVIDECVHLLRIPDALQFDVKLCFSLPECKTTALKEGNNFCFNLDPYPEDFDPKAKFKTDDSYSEPEEEFETLPNDGRPLVNELSASSNGTSKASTTLGNGASTETIYTDAEGHSICIRNLLSVATFGEIDMELNKFGPSERFEILFTMDDDKVSAVITEGCRAEMEGKRRIDHNRRRNNTTKKKSKKKVWK